MSVETEGKSLVELLDMLVPAPEPQPIAMTPQTWGWLVLAAVLAAAIVCGVYLYLRRRRSNAYRRAALAELDAAGNDTAKVSKILRRTALAAYPRAQVASLHGQEWIRFLRQSSDNMMISDHMSQLLSEAPYKNTPPSPEIAQMARVWINTHKPYGRL